MGDATNRFAGRILYNNSSNDFAFHCAGSERVRFASSGNVGIGTATPSNNLHVNSSGNTVAKISSTFSGSTTTGLYIDTVGDTSAARLLFSKSGVTRGIIGYSHNATANSEAITFGTAGGSEKMRITGGGNVGIGTSNNLNDLLTVGTDTDGFTADVTGSVTTMRLGSHATGTAAGRFDYDRASGKLTYKEGPYNSEGDALFTIDNSGKVGIGIDAPGEELHINAPVPTIRLQDSDGIGQYSNLIHSNGLLFLYARNGSSYGTFNFVGDNGTSQNTFTQITENAVQNFHATAWYIRNRVDGGSLHFGVETSAGSLYYPIQMNGTSDVLVFNNAEGEMARFDTNGNLLFSKTALNIGLDGVELRESGAGAFSRTSDVNIYSNRNGTDGSAVDFRKNNSTVGTISVTSSATSYNTSSDQRLKDNIVDAPSASDDIDAIQVRSFDWKADGSHQKYGMVAQELNTVAPEAVTEGDTEDDMMSVDYSKLVPMLVKEIQSLRARVAQLEGAN
jgi:hypothetical protein